jgi:hypothetical protein
MAGAENSVPRDARRSAVTRPQLASGGRLSEVLGQFAWQEGKNMRKELILLLLCPTLCFARSRAAKHTFEVETGYPRGRSGYVVEYRVALACGGADAPYNMQWQTIADGKAQAKRDRERCKKQAR